LHFKGSRSTAKELIGERLLLISKDSKGLVIVDHPAETCPRESLSVNQKKGEGSQALGEATGRLK
jgi:hypothetical protein